MCGHRAQYVLYCTSHGDLRPDVTLRFIVVWLSRVIMHVESTCKVEGLLPHFRSLTCAFLEHDLASRSNLTSLLNGRTHDFSLTPQNLSKLLYHHSLQNFPEKLHSQHSTTALSLSASYRMAKHVSPASTTPSWENMLTDSLSSNRTPNLSASASPPSTAPSQNGPTAPSSPSSANSSARPSSSSSPSQAAKSPTRTCRPPPSWQSRARVCSMLR